MCVAAASKTQKLQNQRGGREEVGGDKARRSSLKESLDPLERDLWWALLLPGAGEGRDGSSQPRPGEQSGGEGNGGHRASGGSAGGAHASPDRVLPGPGWSAQGESTRPGRPGGACTGLGAGAASRTASGHQVCPRGWAPPQSVSCLRSGQSFWRRGHPPDTLWESSQFNLALRRHLNDTSSSRMVKAKQFSKY